MPQQHQSNSRQSIPLVMCPECGAMMGLTVIAANPEGKTSMHFECVCGYEYEAPAADKQLRE